MDTIANAVIDHLGGTTATAKLIEAPISTVHSWRLNGIPQSRLAHMRLAARMEGKPLPEDLAELARPEHDDARPPEAA
ncbi:carph-isopro domain-containing protein [Novosphingobium sp. KN65.2]|uniref:carph-isopro domain-containing protein n=1 Tax=Novosphingobium sp. KN65.2 TaxID=1478134 RepID=UPI0005DA7555|nr:hypothetical protein [Novosphingobium sp. KN65.2]CDO37614.1 conserved hypothetical protein [Novosphingobium sp. KN65.2]